MNQDGKMLIFLVTYQTLVRKWVAHSLKMKKIKFA